jgi:transcriptional regulator with XRE-family HTH domain
MQDPTTPGARLRAIRTGLGLGQERVAKTLGMNPAQISRHEHDKVMFSPPVALRYASFFGVDIDYLMCADRPPPERPPMADTIPPNAATPGARLKTLRLSRGFKKLTPCARLIGVNAITMNHHELGLREITSQRAQVYARFFRVPASYILFGEYLPVQKTVDIVGWIEAGGQVIDMPPGGNEVRTVSIPAVEGQDLIAYAVIGEGLYPTYFHGDVVLTSKPNGHVDPLAVNNRECIVETASGARLIRVVKAEANGRFSIFGPHSPPQMHVRLRRAMPVVQINRGQLRDMPQRKTG